MARAAPAPGIGPEYNAFLYATISADTNGTVLSVLSAMARMNLDPWQEAAELARLSEPAAARRLTSMIAAVPGGPSAPDAPRTIAARLVKLLPSQSHSFLPVLPPTKNLHGIAALAQSRIVLYTLFGLIALALATLLFGAHRPHAPPPNTGHVSETTQPESSAANNGPV